MEGHIKPLSLAPDVLIPEGGIENGSRPNPWWIASKVHEWQKVTIVGILCNLSRIGRVRYQTAVMADAAAQPESRTEPVVQQPVYAQNLIVVNEKWARVERFHCIGSKE